MPILRRLTCYEFAAGEPDDGSKPVLTTFTTAEAEEIQKYLEDGSAAGVEVLRRAAVAFAHATVIRIGG